MSPIQALIFWKRPIVAANPADRLSQLPTEILQHISSFLPLSSRAALSLTSKAIRSILGCTYTELSTSVEERSNFLALIESSFRHHFLCRTCGTLHTRERFDHFEALLRGPWPATCFKGTTAQYFGSGFTLHFHHLYLVMQQHRLGPRYGIATHRLSGRHSSNVDLNCKLRTVTKGCITAAGELVLRAEYAYWRPKPRAVNWREGDITTVYALKICPHLAVYEYGQQRGSLSEGIKCLIKHPDEMARAACTRCVGHKLCLYCPTEFEVGFKKSKKKGLMVEIVAWTNLGKGERADDTTWKAVSTSKKGNPRRFATWNWKEGRIRDEFDAAVAKKKKKNEKKKDGRIEVQERTSMEPLPLPEQTVTP